MDRRRGRQACLAQERAPPANEEDLQDPSPSASSRERGIPRCFTVWLADAGVAAGTSYGRTDEYGYDLLDADGAPLEPTQDRLTPGAVHVHDLHATMPHLLGFDHEALSVPHLGRRFRLTDVHGHVVRELLA